MAAHLVGAPFQLPWVSSSSKPAVLAPCSLMESPSPACPVRGLWLLPCGSLVQRGGLLGVVLFAAVSGVKTNHSASKKSCSGCFLPLVQALPSSSLWR